MAEEKNADLVVVLNDAGRSFGEDKHVHVFNKSDIKTPDADYDVIISAKTRFQHFPKKPVFYKTPRPRTKNKNDRKWIF